MIETNISKPLHRILSDLTGEERFDIALHLATKDLVRLKLKETEEEIVNFENRYKMAFEKFKKAWEKGQIPKKYSYEVEKDYWEWEAAISDQKRLRQMLEQLP
jgi:hypothetical protein